ncbi:MAG: transaldolase [Gammaproteobacteria bacterium]|nr:transaldolase [Gammaproteobacteria bacterium]
MSVLKQLREMTTVVADTGDINSIKLHRPIDATTNPSLLFAAVQMAEYQELVADALERCSVDICNTSVNIRPCLERLAVNFGKEILGVIPGRVSVEVDASLSFDTGQTIEAARRLITMFEQEGIDRSRILIKIASTWEGIRAGEVLEKEGIHCNLTLLFSFSQAVACAEAKVTLISPFVGRIMDWHKAKLGVDEIAPEEDPGVQSVAKIYNYFKHFGYETQVMGASFRSTGEILQLAGCDLLTIAPKFLKSLDESENTLVRRLDPEQSKSLKMDRLSLDENRFRWMLNEDAMATEKLAEGIRLFNADLDHLSNYIRSQYCNDANN